MQIALIPPTPELRRFDKASDMHLALVHLMGDPSYFDFYRKKGAAGEWVTLDNSAHEFRSGGQVGDLLKYAVATYAREIVIPDTLEDPIITVSQAREALKFLASSVIFSSCVPRPRLMLVPQGGDENTWAWCLKQQLKSAEAHELLDLVTVGLSKDYEVFEGGLGHLIDKYLQPLWDRDKIPTHMLGWTCNWNLIYLARTYSCLRSTDTAKPFVYALEGIPLSHDRDPEGRKRPPDYFSCEFKDDHLLSIAHGNVACFKLAARGIRHGSTREELNKA